MVISPLQISTEKAIDKALTFAGTWPVMVGVTCVIAGCFGWALYVVMQRNTKLLIENLDRKHEQQIEAMQSQHQEVVEILKRELFESRKLIKDMTDSIIGMNYK